MTSTGLPQPIGSKIVIRYMDTVARRYVDRHGFSPESSDGVLLLMRRDLPDYLLDIAGQKEPLLPPGAFLMRG